MPSPYASALMPAAPTDSQDQRSQPVPGPLANLPPEADVLQAQLESLAAQIDSLQAQVRQSQKLAILGATAAMIAHEFNNLFTPVVAYARHALDSGDMELMRKALDKTLEQTAIIREMADRVIGLARPADGAVKSINVSSIVQNAIGCLGRDLAKDNISVNVQIDPGLAVRANENQLLQVLFNLVINARQALLGRRGRLTIDAVPTRDGCVQINVRDNGCGIAPENRERIFEPFFTTKHSAERMDRRGLGLGLSICQDIISELGGRIEVSSQVDIGTTFTLTLPAAD